MVLRIQASLSKPPSSITLFRDTTLFAKVFCNLDVLLECNPGTRSFYWRWLKHHGAHDFVDELVRVGEESGYYMGSKNANIRVSCLDYENQSFVNECLYSLKS